MQKTNNKGKILRYLKNAVLPIALSFAAVGCSTIEGMLLNSNIGKQAVFQIEYKFVKTFDEQYEVEDFGYFRNEDPCPEKSILLFYPGFGFTMKEFLDEEKDERVSRLSVMKEVYDNRVLIADYPSSAGLKVIFSNFEKNLLDFINNYMEKNNGKKPRFFTLGHSMGGDISRMFARKHPGYIEHVGLWSGENDGLNMGPFTDFVREKFPTSLEKILIEKGKPHTPENYQSINDLIKGSSFLNELNTPTEPLNIEYNFYAIISKNDNQLVPGDDDGVIGIESSYPIQLIKDRKFENVRIGDAIIFTGDVDHFSTTNLFVLRTILTSLKAEKESYSYELPPIDKAIHIFIPKCPPLEEKRREREKRLMEEAMTK